MNAAIAKLSLSAAAVIFACAAWNLATYARDGEPDDAYPSWQCHKGRAGMTCRLPHRISGFDPQGHLAADCGDRYVESIELPDGTSVFLECRPIEVAKAEPP